MNHTQKITIETTVQVPVEKAWNYYSIPQHITRWNQASDDWHTPHAENDLRTGGSFSYRMEVRDGSAGFDLKGTYDKVDPEQSIDYTLADGRKVTIRFDQQAGHTRIVQTFETENTHTPEQQREGWQAILNNFKTYTETN